MDKLTLTQEDLAYLRTVVAVLAQEIERLPFIAEVLGGARLYSLQNVQADLNAVHTGLKWFIRDRTAPGTVLDPNTHIALTPQGIPGWMVADTDPGEEQVESECTLYEDDRAFGYYSNDDARPRGRHQVDGFS